MKLKFQFGLKALLGSMALAGVASADIVEVSSNIAEDTRWTRDNVYHVTRLIYVLPPSKLTIEPGTVIRGASPDATGFVNSPGTIVVSRGAKIVGNGTADDPIVWTSSDDTLVPGGVNTVPINVTGSSGTAAISPRDYSTSGVTTANAFAYSKLCGGIIVLGKTPIGYDRDGDGDILQWDGTTHSADTIAYPTDFSRATGDGSGFALIEGLTSSTVVLSEPFDADGAGSVFSPDTTFNPGFFGGVDEDDDSGVMRFWSHRYGGFNIAADNEINGLTTGGVGRGTVIEFQEVVQNADDGFEWFGGYVGCRYLASLVNGDDSFDGDFGYSGNLQHLVALNDNGVYLRSGFGGGSDFTTVGRDSSANPDNFIEWDGAEPDTAGVTPSTNSWTFNFTFIGSKDADGGTPGTDDAQMNALKGAEGQWNRGVVEDAPFQAIAIGNAAGSPTDTDTDFFDLLYFNIGAGGFITGSDGDNLTTGSAAATISQLRAKGHATKNGFDPRLVDDTAAGSIARDLTLSAPTRSGVSDFFSPVGYRGAMRDNNWLFGWSWAHATELIPATNMDRPALTINVSGSSVSVAFPADTDETVGGDAVLYVVERSTDGKAWAPFVAVQDGDGSDTDATAGTVAVTDPLAYTGSPVHYRVIPQ